MKEKIKILQTLFISEANESADEEQEYFTYQFHQSEADIIINALESLLSEHPKSDTQCMDAERIQPKDIEKALEDKRESDEMGYTGMYVVSVKDIIDLFIASHHKPQIPSKEEEYGFRLVNIDIKKPPQGSVREDLSKSVLVYDENKKHIGTDHYNLKLNRWLISRDTAKYWLEESPQSESEQGKEYKDKCSGCGNDDWSSIGLYCDNGLHVFSVCRICGMAIFPSEMYVNNSPDQSKSTNK